MHLFWRGNVAIDRFLPHSDFPLIRATGIKCISILNHSFCFRRYNVQFSFVSSTMIIGWVLTINNNYKLICIGPILLSQINVKITSKMDPALPGIFKRDYFQFLTFKRLYLKTHKMQISYVMAKTFTCAYTRI